MNSTRNLTHSSKIRGGSGKLWSKLLVIQKISDIIGVLEVRIDVKTIFVVYAPTAEKQEVQLEKSYEKIDEAILKHSEY